MYLSKILNPKIAPDVQLAACVAASVISKGPAMSWRVIYGVPWLSPIEFTGFGPSNPRDPLKKGDERQHPCDPHRKVEVEVSDKESNSS